MKTIRFHLAIVSIISLLGCNKGIKDSQITYSGTITDIDGNTYNTIIIGDQEWMAENLKTTRFNDGTNIPSDYTRNSVKPYFNSRGDDKKAFNTYGALYNWYAVHTGKLSPEGWHIPSDEEWLTLEKFLIANGYNFDGTTSGNKIAKALSATKHWNRTKTKGTPGGKDYPTFRNKSGFAALPGGFGATKDTDIGNYGNWWTFTESDIANAWTRGLNNYNISLLRYEATKANQYSVRCIKD